MYGFLFLITIGELFANISSNTLFCPIFYVFCFWGSCYIFISSLRYVPLDIEGSVHFLESHFLLCTFVFLALSLNSLSLTFVMFNLLLISKKFSFHTLYYLLLRFPLSSFLHLPVVFWNYLSLHHYIHLFL